jgi:hypothetical protein
MRRSRRRRLLRLNALAENARKKAHREVGFRPVVLAVPAA